MNFGYEGATGMSFPIQSETSLVDADDTSSFLK